MKRFFSSLAIAALCLPLVVAADNVRKPGERLILITRHCQTSNNPEKITKPVPNDTGITKLGIQQAHWLGKEMKRLGFHGAIYSSPYYRATATACEAAKECGSKVYPDARIQQRSKRVGGNIKGGGATLTVFKKLYPNEIAANAVLADDWIKKTVEKSYKGEHQERLEKALDEILAESDKDIAIVSHGGGVGTFLRIMQKRCGIKRIQGTVWNCSLFKFAVDKNGKFRFLGYDISYMPEDSVTSNEGASLLGQKQGKEKKFNSRIDHDDK